MSSLRRSATANLAGRVVTAALWIVATPFVLTRLGPERFGIWSLFFAFNAYLGALDLGIGSTMLRFIAAQRPLGDRMALVRTLRWGLAVAFGLGTIWAVVTWCSRSWLVTAFHVPAPMVSEALRALLIFGAGVLFLLPTQALTNSLQGFERIDLSNICTTSGIVVHVVALYFALSAGLGLPGLATAALVGQTVTGLLASLLVRMELLKVPRGGHAQGTSWRDMVHFSMALQLLWVLIMLQTQSGRFVLGLLGNLKLVADYELAFRVASAVATIPILVRDPVIPAISRLSGGEERAVVAALFASTSRWVYATSVIAFGLLWLLAQDIVRLWLGQGHERIADLIRLWAVAYAANLAYAPGVAIARGIGMPRFEIFSYLAALITNIGLAVWWVPGHGTAGAVAAVVASYVVGGLAFIVPFHRSAGIMAFWPWFRHDLLPRLIAGLAAILLCSALLALPPVAALLPPPGWIHGTITTALFLALFAAFFLPLGDTQRLSQVVWQTMAAAFARRRGAPSS